MTDHIDELVNVVRNGFYSRCRWCRPSASAERHESLGRISVSNAALSELTSLARRGEGLREAYITLHINSCAMLDGGYPGWTNEEGNDRYCCTDEQMHHSPLVTLDIQRMMCRACVESALDTEEE